MPDLDDICTLRVMDANAEADLFARTVPVFLDFAPRIRRMAELAGGRPGALDGRLVPDTFTSGEHLVVAQGFMLRTVFPLLGRDTPALSTEQPTADGIGQRHDELTTILGAVEPGDFVGAASREISHVAGEAEITQDAAAYVGLFAVPNVFFHVTMGYASLRAFGVELGKARFDGLHRYPSGFSFIAP